MQIDSVGKRYDYYYKFNSTKKEYDYEHKGLLNHLMSAVIINTENDFLKEILGFFESSLIFLLKYINKLKDFKNYTKYNR